MLAINGVWLSLVERLIWDQEVAGPNPVTPTIINMVDVAQLASASDCGSESHGFKSHLLP